MTTHDDILGRARQLQEARMEAIRGLVDSRAEIEKQRAKLAEVEQVDAQRFAAALKAGWSETELRQVGITPPARKAPGRPRAARSRNGGGGPVDTHGAPPDSPMEAAEHLRAAGQQVA